ncbi:MAG TPA: sulfatase-like hydrolase/transferase [Solirubrobacterales bacterium]|nr:sulfatase-like hydrolase/transferase [Solirubrobacterales bacterium]
MGRASAASIPRAALDPGRPSFVVIQTDDQPLNEFDRRFRDLYDNWRQIMPKTMALMKDKGITFSQYMTPFPLCAPSRATLLSGRYTQNHEVVRIRVAGGRPGGAIRSCSRTCRSGFSGPATGPCISASS